MTDRDRYYFAPMEGITDVVYRNAHRRWFCPADKYFTAFLVPDQGKRLSEKVMDEVAPDKNGGGLLVPQILTNRSEDFLDLAGKLYALGYTEINLNLGCPSKTVAAKRKGSGFLAFPEALRIFLEKIFENPMAAAGRLKISVKTRLGVSGPEEFTGLLDIYNRFPLHEVIIHPRVQKEYYQGEVHLDEFTLAYDKCRSPVCYNGNLFGKEDFVQIKQRYPGVEAFMAGRGLLRNPGLLGEVKGQGQAGPAQLKGFHDEILSSYRQMLRTERALLARMKEFWNALGGSECIFLEPDKRKEICRIFRVQDIREYIRLAERILG